MFLGASLSIARAEGRRFLDVFLDIVPALEHRFLGASQNIVPIKVGRLRVHPFILRVHKDATF
jgi:hypothetical protein